MSLGKIALAELRSMCNYAPMADILTASAFPDTVAEIEGRLRATGMTVDQLCQAAGVNRATWQRWKAGKTEPQMKVWRRVVAALPAGRGATP